MTLFDQLYLQMFKRLQSSFKSKAQRFALVYVSVCHIAVILLIGVFFHKFLTQMNVVFLSATKAWIIFGMLSFFISFKNWINYSGRKHQIIKAKSLKKKTTHYSLFTLIGFPTGVLALALVLLLAL